MKKLRLFSLVLLATTFFLGIIQPVSAQEEEFGIHLRRNFGYGAGSNVRGNFTISLSGDESQVVSVAFMIDGELMALVEEAPFRYQFHTDNYGFGIHYLNANVILQDGLEVPTATVRLNFVTPDEERGSMVLIFGGIGAILVLSLVIYLLVQALVIKRKPAPTGQAGAVSRYGLLGGTICPKCERAFPRHIWGLNLIVGKYDRCEHCKQWSLTVRATPEQLHAAEQAQVTAQAPTSTQATFAGGDKDALEDTRFLDEL